MTEYAIPGPIDPPPRLLMGPGPISAYPSVLRAMSAPLVGQYDPFMTATMNETQELYRRVWGTRNEATLLVDGTSRAGIEAAMVSLIRPGDRVLVPVFGRFGHLLAEIAERAMAEVHTIEVPWGQVFPASVLDEALASVKPHLLALVQGDTSTTMNQPLDEVGALCRKHGALFYTDATASLGGNPFELDEWGVDAATAGLQKCLGGPSGSAPISLSPRAVEVIRSRAKVEAGIREPGDADAPDFIRSNYFDLGMILEYWGPRRLNHHTEATSMLYAARECARVLLLEGRDTVIERHRLHGAAMLAGVGGLGLAVFGDVGHKMNNVVAVAHPRRGARRCRARRACSRISASRSARPSARCTARSGASGRWATTPARTPCCRPWPRWRSCWAGSGRPSPTGGGVEAAMDVYRDTGGD